MNDAFLPKEYAVPGGTSHYMKLIKGENRFRIISSPILGYEYWDTTADGKRTPIRKRMNEKIDVSTLPVDELPKHFWAMVVYNYADKDVQILEITQKSIQKTLTALAKNPKWGTPVQKYDIVVTKTGDGMETRYETLSEPPTPMDKAILKYAGDLNINLNALYDGADPFAGVDSSKVDNSFEVDMEAASKAIS